MDFGGGFATGIAAGIGSGMAMGVSSGRKQAKLEMRKYIEQNNIAIQDRYGKPIKLDDFLDAACDDAISCNTQSRKWLIGALLLGFVFAAGVLIYFFL